MAASRLPRWNDEELQLLRTDSAIAAAAMTGRTPRACQDKARRESLPVPRMPHARYWPKATIARARRMRRAGLPVSRISDALGVPYGTVRRWIYDPEA